MSEVALGPDASVAEGGHRVYRVGDLEVGIFRHDGRLIGWENRCPHAGGPVCQGSIYRKVDEVLGPDRRSLGLRFSSIPQIVCPWHGFEFNLETGCHPGDERMRLRPVELAVRDGMIYARTPG